MAYGFTNLAKNASSASGTTQTCNFTVASGDTLIVVWIAYTGVVSSATLSDGTHTYTNSFGGGTLTSTLTHRMGTYYVTAPTPGSYTLTLTLGGARSNKRIAIATYSGTGAFQAAVSQDQIGAATTTDAVSTSNMTPSSQPALLTALSFTANGTATYSAGTGHTSRGNLSNWDSIGTFSSLVEDIELTSTSAAAGLFTIGTSRDTLSSGLIFSEAAVVATVSPFGISSTEAFGTATVGPAYPVSISGIASAEAFGTTTVTHIHALSPSGISSSESFGTLTITTDGPTPTSYTGVSSNNLNFGLGVSGTGVSGSGVVQYFTD